MSPEHAPAGRPPGPRSGPDPDARQDVLFTFFADTWTDAVARELCFTLDRMVAEAARHPRVRGVVVANAARNPIAEGLRRLQGRRTPPLPSRLEPLHLARPVRLRRHDPTDTAALGRSYRHYWQQLDRAVRSAGLHEPLVITASPFVAAFAPPDASPRVTYYGYDDWASLEEFRPWWPSIERAYSAIAESEQRVAGVSPRILERVGSSGPTRLIPNGVAPAEWNPPWGAPAWIDRLDRPVLLYLGSIGNRLDLAQLAATAERFESGTVVLVGSVGDPEVLSSLRRWSNVRLEPRIHRTHVPGLVHAADVGIMPHRSTPLTEAMSPLKLYEYLAGGTPVVATDLAPVRGVHHRVELVAPEDAAGFADAVERALVRGRIDESDRVAFVDANSWSDRFDALLDLASGPRDR